MPKTHPENGWWQDSQAATPLLLEAEDLDEIIYWNLKFILENTFLQCVHPLTPQPEVSRPTGHYSSSAYYNNNHFHLLRLDNVTCRRSRCFVSFSHTRCARNVHWLDVAQYGGRLLIGAGSDFQIWSTFIGIWTSSSGHIFRIQRVVNG